MIVTLLYLALAGLMSYLTWKSFKQNGLVNFWTITMAACAAWDLWTLFHRLV